MVEVRPLRGWRYDLSQVGSLGDVTAPPYDVINAEEQNAFYELHPCNVIRLILNRQEPGDADNNARYARAASFLQQWQSEGVLTQEPEEAVYVYHQEFDWEGTHYVRRGFLARIRLEEFGQGQVYPHEKTMSGPKADRLLLTKACQMNLSPIFGLFPDADQRVQTPLEQVTAGRPALEVRDKLNVLHRLWVVTEETAIQAALDQLMDKPVFIADGHHRYETAVNYRNWRREQGRLSGDDDPANFVLMMFVGMSDPGLAILPTHRLISGLPEISPGDLRTALGEQFTLEEIGTGASAAHHCWETMQAENRQDTFGFGLIDGSWHLARANSTALMGDLVPEASQPWRELGVAILHTLVLEHLLKQKYPDAAPQCRYVHLLEEVLEGQADQSCQLACLVAPASIEQVEQIASRFEKMPPKSTFFYPKLLSGLVFNPLQ